MHGTLEQFTPVSLRDLRIDIPDDPLKLAKDQLLIAKAEDTGRVIYLGIPDHPFLGVHFNQFLSGVAPKGSVRFKSDAAADFDMPLVARKEESIGRSIEDMDMRRLHAIHSTDPDIAVPYKEFVRDHNDRWLEAIDDNTYDSLFRHLHDLILIDNKREFTTHLLACWLDCYSRAPSFDGYFIDYLFYEKGNKFGRFLKAQPGFEGTRLKRKYERNPKPYKSSPHSMLGFNMPGVEVIEKYFAEELTEEERIKLTLDHVMYASNVSVDYRAFWDVEKPLLYLGCNVTPATSKKRGLWIEQRDHSRENNPARVRLLSRTKVKVDDDSDTFLHIQARGVIPSYFYDAYNMNVVRYSFGQDFRSRGLYPLLAWENVDGRRRFLRQEEVVPLLPKTGFQYHPQADVFIGRVMAAYFSPQVTDGWDKAMFLQHQDRKERPQNIKNGQVAVWVSLDSKKYAHAPQLLADSNPFFPRLESYAA